MVNSWNEWDELREVIVGTLENKVTTPALHEIPVERKFKNYELNKYKLSDDPDSFDHVKDVHTRVNNYVDLLTAEGISVKRPELFDLQAETKHPLWTSPTQSGLTCPRDVFFIAGNHLVEAPMSWKCRYWENLGYRDMFMKMWDQDPRMKWSAAPKPLLLDSSYQQPPRNTLSNTEILFDAADVRRFGKDIFVQDAHTCNQKGIDWIRRTLAADGLRVHEFTFDVCTYSHIDAKITPISDNTMLWTQSERPSKAMFDLFKENEWNLIECPDRHSCVTTNDMTGPGIHLNMFALGPGKVIVEANEKELIKKLRLEGVDCIPIDYSVAYQWGGGLNCWTLDTFRQGSCKSYFETLDLKQERDEGRGKDVEEDLSAGRGGRLKRRRTEWIGRNSRDSFPDEDLPS